MDYGRFIQEMKGLYSSIEITAQREDEVYIGVDRENFGRLCLFLHKRMHSPVMMYFACDERKENRAFVIYCAFLNAEYKKWFFVVMKIPENEPHFNSIAKEIYSASLFEFKESGRLIREFSGRIKSEKEISPVKFTPNGGFALGFAESWRGPVLFWIKLNGQGLIERCKIVDPSFHNWQGLSFAVLGNIVPDFPLCNKSFDLSYSGNDL